MAADGDRDQRGVDDVGLPDDDFGDLLVQLSAQS
jgi:hypothetical protein